MMLIDLIRHGETEHRGQLLGRTDVALSESGWRQFERQTADRTWMSIVTSPLRRAHEPAEMLAHLRHLPLLIDSDWAEIDFGDWDGRSVAELRADPVIAEHLDAFYCSPDAASAPGGECWSALRARVSRALNGLLDTPAREAVLVVTHAGPMRAALAAACNIPFERTWTFRIGHGTRLTLCIGREYGSTLWGDIIEIVQP